MLAGERLRLHEHRPARPESVAPLRQAVVRFADNSGASERRREDIALAVSEAVSNAVMHAYVGHDPPGDIMVGAWVRGRTLEVVVADGGHGMLPRTDSPGMGLGLALIARVTEHFEVMSLDTQPGVRLRMTFALN